MDKQIEEMARFLYNQQKCCDMTNPYEVADLLINAGYRKESETAEKFAKMLKTRKEVIATPARYVDMVYVEDIDEILKEITEGLQ